MSVGIDPTQHNKPRYRSASMGPTRVKFDESDDEPEQAPMRGGHDSGSNSGGSDGEASSSGRSDSDSEGEHELEQKLSNIPLEVLERLKADGRGPVGAAARAAAAAAKQQTRQGTFKREHKYRPQEVSSKRPVGRFREVIQVPKGNGKDPRFDEVLNPAKPGDKDAAAKRYSFLYDDVLPQEKAALKQRLKKEKSEGRRRDLQAQLTRMEQQLRQESVRRKKTEVEAGWKRQEKAAVASGKNPYFLKKSEKRKMELVAKYEELKASGGLDKYMAKRRKKNAAKDHRYLPSGRRMEAGAE